MIEISELFYSIQGESTRAGLPCVFIRMAGCNLRCVYCDARYTYEEPGRPWTVDELVQAVLSFRCNLVEITGGEPLLQQETPALCRDLLAHGLELLIETNGSMPLHGIPARARLIVDVKCPDSGMATSFHEPNINVLRRRSEVSPGCDEIKFVLSSVKDYRFAASFVETHRLAETATLLFSPVVSRFSPSELAELMLADRLPARLQLQLHTMIWPGIVRGK